MKEIGTKLKEKREENGVSIEEAADDLKVRPSQISAVEDGNKDEFQDITLLKYLIRDYAKYLGLDSEKVVDEFDEYLFDSTSRIPIEEIEQAKKNRVEDKHKISSPYTIESKNKNFDFKKIIFIVIVIILIVGTYIFISKINRSDFNDQDVTYLIGGKNE